MRQLCCGMVVLFCFVIPLRPVRAQAGSKAEGARVFATSGCTHCHAASGEGTDSGPSLRNVRHRLKPSQIQQQIVAGGGEMPAFGTVLDPEQVKALVAFLRAKVWVVAPPEPAASQSKSDKNE